MSAFIVARTDAAFTIQLEIRHNASMLDSEEVIQRRLNEAGVLATAEALRPSDADGSPIQVGDTKRTSKGKLKTEYQTPYGVAPVERHVYRSSRGGRTYCPLDSRGEAAMAGGELPPARARAGSSPATDPGLETPGRREGGRPGPAGPGGDVDLLQQPEQGGAGRMDYAGLVESHIRSAAGWRRRRARPW